MAYKLFIEKIKTDTFDKYLKVALENASEPIFISNADADVIFCNKAYLKITGMEDSTTYTREISEYAKFTKIFSDTGQLLPQDDWASTRGLKGKQKENEIFYVYNAKIDMILVNYYTYAPIYDGHKVVIGSYVKIGLPVESPDPAILESIKSHQLPALS